MDCSQPGQELGGYPLCEVSVIWIRAEIFATEVTAIPFVIPIFPGSGLSLQSVQVIATAKAISNAISAKMADFF